MLGFNADLIGYSERLEVARMRGQMALNVANAWRNNQAYGTNQDSMRTDGVTVWSYAHVIGITASDGSKIAYDCHYSATTAKHSHAIMSVANEIAECPTNGHRGCDISKRWRGNRGE